MGGGMGGMPNLPPGLMNDPEFMQIFSDPAAQELMPVFAQAQSDPARAQQLMQQYAGHPLMQRLARVLQRHGMGGGMGGGMGNGGWGAPPASSPAAAQPTNYKNISSAIQLDTYLSTPDRPSIIYFTMHGCGPCARIAPFWERMASAYNGQINFLKVQNTCRDLVAKYDVKAFPTFVIIINREQVENIRGADSAMLEAKIKIWANKAQMANAPKARFVHFPVNPANLPVFAKSNLTRASKKLIETNNSLREAGSDACCDDTELSLLFRFRAKLETSQSMGKSFDDREYALMEKLLNWDAPGCYPALESPLMTGNTH